MQAPPCKCPAAHIPEPSPDALDGEGPTQRKHLRHAMATPAQPVPLSWLIDCDHLISCGNTVKNAGTCLNQCHRLLTVCWQRVTRSLVGLVANVGLTPEARAVGSSVQLDSNVQSSLHFLAVTRLGHECFVCKQAPWLHRCVKLPWRLTDVAYYTYMLHKL